MHVLAPIDGSECSYRALSFATEFVTRYEASLDVVHISTQEGPKTEKILRRAEEVLEENDVPANAEIVTNLESADPRYGNRKGKDILRLVEKTATITSSWVTTVRALSGDSCWGPQRER